MTEIPLNSIILGDCLDIMKYIPDGTIDTVITDPVWPDNSLQEFSDMNPEELFIKMINSLPKDVKRIAVILNCDSDPRFLRDIPKEFKFFRVQWLRYSFPGHKGRLLNSGNVAYLFGEPPKPIKGKMLVSGESTAHALKSKEKIDHPCPRRLEHIKFVVNQWSNPEDTILDPFAGSGTTAIACHDLKRNFICIEKESEYHRAALKRYEEAKAQLTLF